MEELKKLLNDTIKEEYSNTDDLAQYIEVYLENGTLIVSFLKRQHAEEFMRYHDYLLEDYDFKIEIQRMRVEDISYVGTPQDDESEESDEGEDELYLEVDDVEEINDILDEIQRYIYIKTHMIHFGCKKYEHLSDEWMMEMSKVTPLIDVHNYINSKKKKLKFRMKG